MMMVYAGSRFCVPLTIIIPLLTSTDLRDAFSPSKLERTWADLSYKAAEFPLLSRVVIKYMISKLLTYTI